MPESKRPKPVKRTEYFSRGILVIWPKNQSSVLYLRYGMNSILKEMENSLTSVALVEEEVTREEVTRKLREIISLLNLSKRGCATILAKGKWIRKTRIEGNSP